MILTRILALSLFSIALAACSAEEPRAIAQKACKGVAYRGRMIEINTGSPRLESLLKEKEVILTFDDGPHPSRTEEMLSILKEYCVPAVFFLRGDNAYRHPQKVRTIWESGHLIGGHSVRHDHLPQLEFDEATADIDPGIQLIADALHEVDPKWEPKLFRFPYFDTTPELSAYVKQRGLVEIGANASGKDWFHKTPESIVNEVMTRLAANKQSGVILLHDPFEYTNEAIVLLLDELIAQGYVFSDITITD